MPTNVSLPRRLPPRINWAVQATQCFAIGTFLFATLLTSGALAQQQPAATADRELTNQSALQLIVPGWQALAVEGSAEAQNRVGSVYYHGLGLPKDLAAAFYWFQKAAVQGHPDSETWLGRFYAQGLGVPLDKDKALSWTKKAADRGYARAQYNLGVAYMEGQIVAQNYPEAGVWLKKAAEQGDRMAQYNLALLFAGKGDANSPKRLRFKQDKAQSIAWLEKAARQGLSVAQAALARRYFQGDGVPKSPLNARAWLLAAAAQGHAEAQFLLYAYAANEPESQARALTWLRASAQNGWQEQLGSAYGVGALGLKPDNELAKYWLLKAAEQGNAAAQGTMGRIYLDGQGGTPDRQKAIDWFRKAAAQGNPRAIESLKKLDAAQ